MLGTLPQSERTFVISGYIPEAVAGKVADGLMKKYDCMVDVEELKEDEEPPVILKNNPFSANMEGVVESYGLPVKGEIDPTTIMSFFYVFFFGMMLSDAAYGVIVSIVCGILVLKFPRMSPGMKKSFKALLLLRTLDHRVGCPVWRIFWKYRGYRLGEIFSARRSRRRRCGLFRSMSR